LKAVDKLGVHVGKVGACWLEGKIKGATAKKWLEVSSVGGGNPRPKVPNELRLSTDPLQKRAAVDLCGSVNFGKLHCGIPQEEVLAHAAAKSVALTAVLPDWELQIPVRQLVTLLELP
jgi:hypothetical protein